MREKIPIVVLLLVCCIGVYAEQPIKALSFRVSWDEGYYIIDELGVVMDFPLKVDENGNYLIKLIDEKEITLYQHKTKKVNVRFGPWQEPESEEIIGEEIIIDFDELIGTKKGQMFFLLPYLEEAETLTFEHGINILAKADLSVLCEKNGKCEEPENYLSCPEDCSLEKEDKYCHAYIDGKCDPDCVEGIDPDCEETPKPTETPKPWPFGIDLAGMVIIGGIMVILLIILVKRVRQ